MTHLTVKGPQVRPLRKRAHVGFGEFGGGGRSCFAGVKMHMGARLLLHLGECSRQRLAVTCPQICRMFSWNCDKLFSRTLQINQRWTFSTNVVFRFGYEGFGLTSGRSLRVCLQWTSPFSGIFFELVSLLRLTTYRPGGQRPESRISCLVGAKAEVTFGSSQLHWSGLRATQCASLVRIPSSCSGWRSTYLRY